MNKNEFIKILEEKESSFETANNKIIINGGYVDLSFLKTLPSGITFNNSWNVDLSSLETLPSGITFNNGGGVYLNSLETLPSGITFNNGGDVSLDSLETLPSGITFNNSGYVYLNSIETLPSGITFNNGRDVYYNKNKTYQKTGTYLERNKVVIEDNHVILFKKVSEKLMTQEGEKWETKWLPGSTLEHSNWNPKEEECGKGKFHACARPGWCDTFRNKTGDKYIAIKIHVNNLYEWTNNPDYPQKIAFRKGTVLFECDRNGKQIK